MLYLLMKIKLEAINFHTERRTNEKLSFLMVFNQFSVSLYTHLITKKKKISLSHMYINFSFFDCMWCLYICFIVVQFTIYFKKKKKIYIFLSLIFPLLISLIFSSLTSTLSLFLICFSKKGKENNEERAKEIFLWLKNICYIYHIIQYLITSISHRCSFPSLYSLFLFWWL